MKKKIKTIPLLLACYFIICIIPFAAAVIDKTAPVSKTAVIGTPINFQPDELLRTVDHRDQIEGILISDLPDPKVGVLKFAGNDLLPGDAVTIENINAIQFVPSSQSVASVTFRIIPVYKSGDARKAVNINVHVLASKNVPPTCTNFTLQTAKNISTSGYFRATDPENDPVIYEVTSAPKLGSITICAGNENKFIYTPYQDKIGSDTFTYIAKDKAGNNSTPATVKITITKPKLKLAYADMMENGAHYAALQLAERNILVGETIGDVSFFYPNRPISRSEFIAMVVSAFDLPKSSAVANCGFADNNVVATWARSYISCAKTEGLINGNMKNKKMIVRPNATITRGEAAVILNAAISLSNTTTIPTFADIKSIPSWAKQASVNVAVHHILPVYADGSLRINAPLNRADAAEIIYSALCTGKGI